ncbi:hypothetical protein KJ966_14370 [bacterium]|nr:hypothetical protein [bacterium]
MIPKNTGFLILGGLISLSIAFLHIILIFFGAPAYRYFGAGETMAIMAESGSPVPALLTLMIAGVFMIFALYAFSGAKILKPLPLLRPILFTIGLIFSLRGLLLFYSLYLLWISPLPTEAIKHILFSLVSLGTGILYLSGTILSGRYKGV